MSNWFAHFTVDFFFSVYPSQFHQFCHWGWNFFARIFLKYFHFLLPSILCFLFVTQCLAKYFGCRCMSACGTRFAEASKLCLCPTETAALAVFDQDHVRCYWFLLRRFHKNNWRICVKLDFCTFFLYIYFFPNWSNCLRLVVGAFQWLWRFLTYTRCTGPVMLSTSVFTISCKLRRVLTLLSGNTLV